MIEPTDRNGLPLTGGRFYRSQSGNEFFCTLANPLPNDACFVRQSDGETFTLAEVGEWRDGVMIADLEATDDPTD